MSLWFLLLTLHRARHLCNLPPSYTLFVLIFLLQIAIEIASLCALQGQRLKYSVSMVLICILYCDNHYGYLIRAVCKHSVLLPIRNRISYYFIFVQPLFRDYCSFTSIKLYVCQEMFIMFLASI